MHVCMGIFAIENQKDGSGKTTLAIHLAQAFSANGYNSLILEAQRESVQRFVKGRGEILAEYVETESGRKVDRPQLIAALAHCRSAKATLLIAKLDRLARNVAFIANLMNSDVEFVARGHAKR